MTVKTAIKHISKSTEARWSRCPYMAHAHAAGLLTRQDTEAAQSGRIIHAALRALRETGQPLEENILFSAEALEKARLIAAADKWANFNSFKYEEEICWSLHWRRTPRQTADYIVIADRIGPVTTENGEEILVQDIKTGYYTGPNFFERDISIAAARIIYPTHHTFRFEYETPSGCPSWLFTFPPKGPETITDCQSGHTALYPRGALRARIVARRSRIMRSAPQPNPGPHCSNWYGEPCPAINNGCPISAGALAMVPAPATPIHRASIQSIFASAVKGDIQLTPDSAAILATAINVVRAAASHANTALFDWLKKSPGLNAYTLNNKRYTAEPTIRLNKRQAWKILLDTMDQADLLSAVDLSPSSLKNISATRYPGLRERILSAAAHHTDSLAVKGVPLAD